MYCFTILGSASIVIHSVKQHLLRNRPGSDINSTMLESPETLRLVEHELDRVFEMSRVCNYLRLIVVEREIIADRVREWSAWRLIL